MVGEVASMRKGMGGKPKKRTAKAAGAGGKTVRRAKATSSLPGARSAVVLLSGGLDSATAAAVAKSEGFTLHALTVDYGQRHSRELEGAVMVGQSLGVHEHVILRLPLGQWGGSSLTDAAMEVPLGKKGAPVGAGIPTTYVPARNLVLLAIASSYAEAVGADAIFIGANEVDFSGYPDCRADFLSAFERAASLGTKRGREGNPIRVNAPLVNLSKADIIKLGISLGVDYSLTWSCYVGGERPCGRCDSCRIRADGFKKAKKADPALRMAKGSVTHRARGKGRR